MFGNENIEREKKSLPVEPLTHSNFRFQEDHLAVPSATCKYASQVPIVEGLQPGLKEK